MSQRRPVLIAVAFGIALALVAAIIVAVVVGRGAGSAPDAGGSASGSSSAEGEDTATKLQEIGSSAADLDADPAEDQEYADYYDQRVDWGSCQDDEYAELQCGTVTVPVRWNDPAAGDLEISMIRQQATGESEGSLLVNPGGPGVSGVDMVGRGGSTLVGEEVSAHHDLVGFDPRGVARSEPVTCLDDHRTDTFVSTTIDWGVKKQRQRAHDLWDQTIDACEKKSGDILPYVDTLSATRDLDVLRSAVGDQKLDFLGFSYGTYLGATYAETYPERVGRMVLDGAMDPALSLDEVGSGQVAAREKELEHFIDHCLDQGSDVCPLEGDRDQAHAQVKDFLDALVDKPIRTGDPDRPLTAALAESALTIGLYQDESWDFLMQALQSAMNGDGTSLLYFADSSNGRSEDGTYDGNALFAMTAVNQLDRPQHADEGTREKQQAALEKQYPVFGSTYGVGGPDYGQWPEKPVREPAPIHAEGAAPIVVIGTTGDPATPYAWAKSLASQLDSGTLITWKGEGHTAYGRSGGCVETAVNTYLAEGTTPEEGLTCS